MNIFQTFIYAFFAGLFPALFWLWFWLHEDKKSPEPRSILALTFTTGMAMIFLAMPLEWFFQTLYGNPETTPFSLIIIWVIIEELLKFLAVLIAALHTKAYDEPIDAIVYMMCAALGFAALENTLFILKTLNDTSNLVASAGGTGILTSVFLANLRFIGANLLHIVASSTIGIALALSFYKTKMKKVIWAIGGIFTAIVLHALFNLFIIYNDGSNNSIFLIFLTIWLIMIGFILVFEKIKKMRMPIIQ
jgi:protease PrsW